MMAQEIDPYASARPGCALTPGVTIALVFSLVWITVVVPFYRKMVYGDPEPPQQVEQPLTPELDGARTPAEIAENIGEGLGTPALTSANSLAEAAGNVPAAKEALPATQIVPSTDPGLPARSLKVGTDAIAFEFTSRGAAVRSASLREYHHTADDPAPLAALYPFGGDDSPANSFVLRAPAGDGEGASNLGDLAGRVWELETFDEAFDADGRRRVAFTIVSNGIQLRKTYLLRKSGAMFDVDVEVVNRTGKTIESLRLELVGPNGLVGDETATEASASATHIVAVLAGRDDPRDGITTKEISFTQASSEDVLERTLSKGGNGVNEWAAVKNRFFAAIVQSTSAATVEGFVATAVDTSLYKGHPRLSRENIAVASKLRFADLRPLDTAKSSFCVYLGPLHQSQLAAAVCGARTGEELGWTSLISYGWFASLSKLLLLILQMFYYVTQHLGTVIGGYGLAIFLTTLVFKGALHPLQRKMMVSMTKMQKLAPEMKEIRKRYEKDKALESQRKMQREIMELQQKHGASMSGGCLPMLVQLPMFIAFYGMLRGAFELRQANYLWIDDLSQPDVLFGLGFMVPFLGDSFRLLPIIYTGLFLLQQRLQPQSEDPQQQQAQKTMKIMSIVFFFIFYNMPSGLVLYFVFSNAFGLLESWYIRTYLLKDGGAPGRPATALDAGPAPQTSWDREAEREARAAEKRKKRDERGNTPKLR